MPSSDSQNRIDRARAGDVEAWSQLLAEHAPRLERMVALRMHGVRLSGVEAADIVQDALLDAARRFAEWRTLDRYPPHTWLRLLAVQALNNALRHSAREKREHRRERDLEGELSRVTPRAAADWLVSTHTTPTQAARRNELRDGVCAALEALEASDRDVILLRLFEQLSNDEAAAELGITPAAATKRFTRALQRLSPVLKEFGVDGEVGV